MAPKAISARIPRRIRIFRVALSEQVHGLGKFVEKPHCLWCDRAFRPRTTGGSALRFCSTEHRKAFWTAARRWTMRAIETGLCYRSIASRPFRRAYTLWERSFGGSGKSPFRVAPHSRSPQKVERAASHNPTRMGNASHLSGHGIRRGAYAGLVRTEMQCD
jgi:hypothetical protein